MCVVSNTTILSEGAVEITFLFPDDSSDFLGRKVEVEKYRGSRFHLIAFNINAKHHNIHL